MKCIDSAVAAAAQEQGRSSLGTSARLLQVDDHALLVSDANCEVVESAFASISIRELLARHRSRALHFSGDLGSRAFLGALDSLRDRDDSVVLAALVTPGSGWAIECFASSICHHNVFSWSGHAQACTRRHRVLTVSGHQPAYHPYLPYFAKIAASHVFTFATDMRFGRATFQHRQKIPIDSYSRRMGWLTLPVERSRRSMEVSLSSKRLRADQHWALGHLRAFRRAYGKLPFYGAYDEFLAKVYGLNWRSLVGITQVMTVFTMHALGIRQVAHSVSDVIPFNRTLTRGRRIADEIREVLGTNLTGDYLCGASGAKYLLEAGRSGGRRELDPILSLGLNVVQCDLNAVAFREATPLADDSSAFAYLCSLGSSTGKLLVDNIRLRPVASRK
jgi:hypothetical protein